MSSTPLSDTRVAAASAAATTAATEAEGSAQRGPEFRQHFADRITNRGGAAARVKQSDRIVRSIIRDDQ